MNDYSTTMSNKGVIGRIFNMDMRIVVLAFYCIFKMNTIYTFMLNKFRSLIDNLIHILFGILKCVFITMCLSGVIFAEEIGSVDTKFNLLSPDDSIRIEVVRDPKIDGVVCYLSRAQKGGYKGALGLAEDTSDASIDCRQVGPIKFLEGIKKGESVFKERRSFIFKKLKVVRFCDTKYNSIVYLVYSEKIIEGSPKNSLSAVPMTKWHTQSNDEQIEQCEYK